VKRVAIIQPNYVPWKGYFDIIHDVDTFVFLDDVQYTVRDWRNRNRIKTRDGQTIWLSVPILGGRNQRICDVEINRAEAWQRKHIEAARHSYGKMPGFAEYFPRFVDVLGQGFSRLGELDIAMTREICGWLGLDREFYRSSELSPTGTKDERLIDLVQKVGGDHYLSGPAARDYIRAERFAAAHIGLAYHDYAGYPAYPQLGEPFDHHVSILDLVFAVGRDTPDYIWGARRVRTA
jgi:hypothetical protein